MSKMAREAVDRSCGQLVEFSMEHFGTDELVEYIADRSSSLRCLRLVSCNQVGDDALINMAKKAVMLEELEVCHSYLSRDTLKTVLKACPLLKLVRHNFSGFIIIEGDGQALAIAENMSELRHLHLYGDKLTNVGLSAILNGCLHLESLDLRRCVNVNLEGDLLKSCRDRRIKVRLPGNDDYEFDAATDHYYNAYDGYVDHGADVEYGYDNECASD